MSKESFNSLEDFEGFVSSTMEPWTAEQRTVLAAAMADRWLPVYESFSEEYEWGDPQTFEDAVVAVWNCVLGHKLSSKDGQVHYQRVKKNTPHMDNFDCEEVIATSAMIYYALKCCANSDNTEDAVMAMVSGFEAVAPGIYSDPEDLPPDVWQSPHVQNELEKQLKLLKLIGEIAQIDKQSIEALRQNLASPEFAGTVAPRPEPPKGVTNEAIFEQYRRFIEIDLKNKWDWENDQSFWKNLGDNTGASTMLYLGEWLGRYVRRKDAIEENKMLDVAAHDALLARNATRDAAVQGDPAWNHDARLWIEMCYQNPISMLDANAPEKLHRYGPSLRRLYFEFSDSVNDVLKSILRWARHRPAAWEEEDLRKKKKLAYTTPELGQLLSRELSWRATGDVDHPWTTDVAGETWRVRLNDFPDDIMYTLVIDDKVVGNFHDWPKSWRR